ncbi:5-demethoxyubiquinol-8 5-hydroxylase UbiM [Candidatus Kirkpatrickella diaphorinae]|uniref:5-demethoxyubiquinol-8 5-hydroxylase UbiM n=1 Tax=Candidatus Kirkpatrickella diaphorinae TaxID=2984322 RepID=A0ABY6GKF2_9PROT|nr:5-demethoxyubiquinol-8 5-hydroxylase UbiM [Candidatus Kirkpatrickella diaphorinae]UYH51945.1 5-demethoxyubiquinol-8 5-hydroxylase UbiM [Candidatus Kirkpatrickella diaphorinae]
MNTEFDIVIIGGGAAGLSCALSMDRLGFHVAVIEQAPETALENPRFDGRELALTHHTIAWLKDYNVWPHFALSQVTPLQRADILSGHDAARAARKLLSFESMDTPSEERAPLGYLVAHHVIRKALYEEVRKRENITVICGKDALRSGAHAEEAHMDLDDGRRFHARLIVAADGRFSRARAQRGIGAVTHDFRRHILVCRLSHTRPHHDIATQWFDEGQTLAFLPVGEKSADGRDCSSLVLTLKPDDISRLAHMAAPDFVNDIAQRLQGQLGAIDLVSARCTYPLKAVYAHRFRAARFALIGDAAVGMHPITAHGFNFGLKGQETLARKIADGAGDPGEPRLLRQFEMAHRRDTMPLFAATNAIATLYTRDAPLSLKLREATLQFAQNSNPLKRFVARVLSDH